MRTFLKLQIIALVLVVSSCQNAPKKNQSNEQLPLGTHRGEVSDVIQTASYTYLLVEENGAENWIAIPQEVVNKGETIYYDGGLEMKNFESKALGRVFETVYFVQSIRYEAVKPVQEAIQEKMNKQSAVSKTDVSIDQPEGAVSVARIFENQKDFADKRVTVRGKVVKVNNGILGVNWLHIQDGSNYNGDFDLTVTTDELFSVGDEVTFIGKLGLNKDFGAGYSYPVILEEAKKVKMQ
ncbi:hypothetical protein [Carboxylicivirga sp. N1Y90]|uniref:hypothetical protein n=1 Tax=Carboxylicivirga fragile TaxID=3417571 RepID=UPI003D32BEC9|nr:hypothetical protein [Marinilabiliaceae bacterium N1Y90]